jgi:hypothetical protein
MLTSRNNHFVLDPGKPLLDVAARLGWKKAPDIVFDSPPPEGLEDAAVLMRNHPFVVAVSERFFGEAFTKLAMRGRQCDRCEIVTHRVNRVVGDRRVGLARNISERESVVERPKT